MASHLATVDGPPSDGELISLVRAGDTDAYGELFARHVDAARRLARQLVSAGDVDDLVSEAFAKVLVVLQRGGGPDLAFRAYLLTAVRRLHVDRIRAGARLHTTADLTPFDPGVPFRDTAVEGFESATAARAFAALPERWQLVLWHTEVEGQKPAEVATLLGMSPNSVSALAYRAREGLRQAYLSLHAQDVDEDACARTRANLGAYVRGGLSRRDSARVEQHLEECRRCAAIYLELTEVNSNLGALLAPLLLGAAAAAYVGTTSAAGGAAAVGGVVALLDRAKDAVLAHGPTAAVAGAAASVVAAGLLITLHQGAVDAPTAGDAPAVRSAPSAGTTAPSSPAARPDRAERRSAAGPPAAVRTTAAPTS
ncbi:sigma-70 family RNA polymerase sigma factor, partial [Nocardioides aquiterrae]|uniref:sigma-70 family RNA polymerase sigma factor n=1 Tax=Nocardioides aquiterrae TaxID=203799 RepID=UPI0031D38F11